MYFYWSLKRGILDVKMAETIDITRFFMGPMISLKDFKDKSLEAI
jgi:hypothetical protein